MQRITICVLIRNRYTIVFAWFGFFLNMQNQVLQNLKEKCQRKELKEAKYIQKTKQNFKQQRRHINIKIGEKHQKSDITHRQI